MSASRIATRLSTTASQSLRVNQVFRPPFVESRVARITLPKHVRYYSQPTESESQAQSTQPRAPESTDAEPVDPSKQELEAKKKELVEVTDRLKRSVAEYRNLQEQTKREIQAARDYAIQRFAKDLVESIDNLDRAITTVPEDKLGSDGNKELLDLHGGLKMTERILLETVKRHGLERFDPSENGDKFDPNRHEATFQAPQQDKVDGTVFYTQSKGYVLNGRVLKAAKVGVVKNS